MAMISLRTLSRIGLIALALFTVSRGASYLSFVGYPAEDLPGAIRVFHLPVTFWAVVWFAGGVATIAAAVRAKAWGYLPSIGLALMWAAGYAFATYDTGVIRQLASSALYLSVATLAFIGAVLTVRFRGGGRSE